MLPPQVLGALAPLISAAITGKGKDAALPAAVETLLTETIDHEKSKAAVRPQMMRRMGNLTILQTVVISAIGVAYAFGGIADWERALGAALIIGGGAGVSGGSYLYGATKRTVEKVKGAA